MKKTVLFLVIVFIQFINISEACFSQQRIYLTLAALRSYEGLYQTRGTKRLELAASPVDTVLWAILGKSRYPLKAVRADLFITQNGDSISFTRNASGLVKYYTVKGERFTRLSSTTTLTRSSWYARPAVFSGFSAPANTGDGLEPGALNSSGLDTNLLKTMTKKIIDGSYPNVHSVLIIKDGKLVFEEYFYDYGRDSLQELRSATKSFVSALVGIAIKKGLINSTNEKVLSYFPEYHLKNLTAAKKQITIKNMLSNQTGLDCDISNGKSEGSETLMDQSSDWVKFTLDLPLISNPGSKGMYCSGNPITLSRIIEKRAGIPFVKFADKNLLSPLGIKNYKWNFKPDKTSEETFCQIYLTPREMAKFGQMYLDKGFWKGKQVVPSAWVTESWLPHSVVQGVDYGYFWWLKYLDAGGIRYYGKLAQGNGGQKIFIWDKQHMVTVITGGSYNMQSPANEIIATYILPSFNSLK